MTASRPDVQLILATFDQAEGHPTYRRIRGPQSIGSWRPLQPGDYASRSGVTPPRSSSPTSTARPLLGPTW